MQFAIKTGMGWILRGGKDTLTLKAVIDLSAIRGGGGTKTSSLCSLTFNLAFALLHPNGIEM